MRKLFLFLSLTVILFCPARSISQRKTTIETLRDRGVIVERVSYRGEDYFLCIVNAEEGETEWFIITPSGNRKMRESPSSLAYVSEIKPSPDRRFLAIISVGEGHPILDLVDLTKLLTENETRTIASVNPYPGTINMVRWSGDRLIVTSDALLTRKDEEEPFLTFFQQESFSVNAASGAIAPLSMNAKNPVGYFTGRLADKESYSRAEAARALARLKDKSAIAHLELALGRETDPQAREMIEKAILELKR
ncbi:MAG: hypothetical protein AB1631_18905 [Acidobacteriota bacterium]